MGDAATAGCSQVPCANPSSFSLRKPQACGAFNSKNRAHPWRTLPFASRRWLISPILTDCHCLASQTSYHCRKVPQEGIWTFQRLTWTSLTFRFRLIARANTLGEGAGESVDARPLHAMQYSSNETPLPSQIYMDPQKIYDVMPSRERQPQQSASAVRGTDLTKGVSPTSNRQTTEAKSNEHEAGMGIDAPQRSLEEDYGILKEQIEKDRKVQLATKQDLDKDCVMDTGRPLKRSKVVAKQVISQSSARLIGFVSQLWVSVQLFRVVALEVRPSLLSGEIDRVFLADVCQIGDVVLVNNESALENEMTATDCETLVGYDVVTEGGNYIGKIRDYSFDLQDGKLTSLDYDSVGISLVPSSLISTFRLDAEEVIEVLTDSILVKDGAQSRIKRLTKGFWQLPSTGAKRRNQKTARSRVRTRRFSESTECTGQARQLPSRTRARYSEGVDFEGLDAREEPADGGFFPNNSDRLPKSRRG
ncbi:hypothetical protein L7F22_051946 [Adiantum nelumboides]|nr:hypothetical protein [Adiantum nelumboides]